MSNLAAFIEARIDEDEAAALACADYDGNLRWIDSPVMASLADHTIRTTDGSRPVCRIHGRDSEADNGERTLNPHAQAAHIARHDPARALRGVAAMRAILAEWQPPEYAEHPERHPGTVRDYHDGRDPGEVERDVAVAEAVDYIVRQMASIWSDHPDYDPGWTPWAAATRP